MVEEAVEEAVAVTEMEEVKEEVLEESTEEITERIVQEASEVEETKNAQTEEGMAMVKVRVSHNREANTSPGGPTISTPISLVAFAGCFARARITCI